MGIFQLNNHDFGGESSRSSGSIEKERSKKKKKKSRLLKASVGTSEVLRFRKKAAIS
ncbi:hypothetical protein QG37_06264 [Candidozyma auris]|uniref:Uncharacterized protein n=1 Tax=Candidozyma auris TaxID=498019 RepID=A0A0L0NUJ1_CANAR|nr:hypothetical protein QG37_06264 [[Candida] auris]